MYLTPPLAFSTGHSPRAGVLRQVSRWSNVTPDPARRGCESRLQGARAAGRHAVLLSLGRERVLY